MNTGGYLADNDQYFAICLLIL